MKYSLKNRYHISMILGIALLVSAVPIDKTFPILVVIFGLLFGIILISFSQKEERYFLTRIFIIAFLLRVIISIYFYNVIFLYNGEGLIGDSYAYGVNGGVILDLWYKGERNLARLSEEAFRLSASGNLGNYDFWNAIVFYFTGVSPFTMIFINCLASALTIVLVYQITKQVWNYKAAKFATFLTAFWPSTFFWSIQNLKEPLVIFFTISLIWAIVKLRRKFRFYLIFIIICATTVLSILRDFLVPILYFFVLPCAMLCASKHKKIIIAFLLVLGICIIYGSKLRNPDFFTLEGFLRWLMQKRTDRAYGNLAFFSSWDITNIPRFILFLPVSFLMAIFAPFPWQLGSLSQIASLPEMLLFYYFIPAMFLGIKMLVTNEIKEGWVLIVYIFTIAFILALIEGNVGTLFRHRAIILPIYFVFIGIGMDKCKFKITFRDS